MLDFAVARASETLLAAGAEDLIIESPLAAGGWHLMGTARMGVDPQKSIVNEWGRSHDVKKLVCSGWEYFRYQCRSESYAHNTNTGFIYNRPNEKAFNSVI
jgi:hypothetical protein